MGWSAALWEAETHFLTVGSGDPVGGVGEAETYFLTSGSAGGPASRRVTGAKRDPTECDATSVNR